MEEVLNNNQYLNITPSNKIIYRLGGLICLVFIAYSLATMLIMVLAGTPPDTVIGIFNMLNGNKLIGLLRLDI